MYVTVENVLIAGTNCARDLQSFGSELWHYESKGLLLNSIHMYLHPLDIFTSISEEKKVLGLLLNSNIGIIYF